MHNYSTAPQDGGGFMQNRDLRNANLVLRGVQGCIPLINDRFGINFFEVLIDTLKSVHPLFLLASL